MEKIVLYLTLCFGSLHSIAQDVKINSFINPIQIATDSCYGLNENISLNILNSGNSSIDFSVDTLNIHVDVSGDTTFQFNYQINNNSINSGNPLAVGDSIFVSVGTIDMRKKGSYNFIAILNLDTPTIHTNDTLRYTLVNAKNAGKIFGTNSICGNDSVKFKLIGSAGEVQWQRLVSGIFIDEVGADSIIHAVYLDSTTTFRAVVCGTELSDTLIITRENIPPLPIGIGDSALVVCGDSTELIYTATSLNPNTSFLWFNDSINGSFLKAGGDVLSVSSNGDSIRMKVRTPLTEGWKDTLYLEEVFHGTKPCVKNSNIDTLTAVPFLGGLSCSAGNMFDLIAKNEIQIHGFSINCSLTGEQNVKVYIKEGTYVNSIYNANDWVLYDSVKVYGNGAGIASYLELSKAIKMEALDTIGIYINYQAFYTPINFGTMYANNDLQLMVGDGVCSPFSTNYRGRGFNGQVIYAKKSRPRIPVIGLVECIPYTDLSITSLNKPVVSNTRCSTNASEAVEIILDNKGGLDIDFTTDTVEIVVNITGALNQMLSYEINNNSLNTGNVLEPGQSITVPMGNIDMSGIGNYTFKSYLISSADTFPLNDTLLVNVSNVISAGNIVTGTDTICGTQIVRMNAINSIGTLQWQRLIGNNFVDETNADSNFYEVNIDSTTLFRVLSCGIKISDTLTIDHFPVPSMPMVKDDTLNTCGNIGTLKLIASSILPRSTMNWYADAFSKNVLFKGDTFQYSTSTSNFPASIIDTFYVAVEDSLSGCVSPKVMVQGIINFIGPIPHLDLGNDTLLCKSSAFRLNAALGFTSYQWNTGHQSNSIIPSIAHDSLYIVSVVDTLGCSVTDSIIVVIDSCVNLGTYLFEDFNSGIPPLWKDSVISGSYNWKIGSINILKFYQGSYILDTITNIDGTSMRYFNDDSLGYLTQGATNDDNTVVLFTPVLKTLTKVPLLLEFDYNYRDYSAIADSFMVDVFDGNSWVRIFQETKNNPFSNWKPTFSSPHAKIDISSYSNKDLQVKFTYHDGNDWGFWAAIDNVLIHHPHKYYPIGKINKADSTGLADSLNGKYWTSGIVAGIDLDGGNALSFTLIDTSSGMTEGINVYSSTNVSNYTVNEGDSILLMGEISQQNGLQQFIPDSIQLISTGHSLPLNKLVEILDESTESQLIRLEDLEISAVGSGSGAGNDFDLTLTDGTRNYTAFIDSDTDIADSLSFSPGQILCSISGIGGQMDPSYPYTAGYRIIPMSYLDIAINATIDLGVDTIICDTALLLDAGPGFLTYRWNTGDTTQKILATSLNDSLYVVVGSDSLGCSYTDSIIVRIEVCTDIEIFNSNSRLEIYPNPSRGIFKVIGSNISEMKEITVYNSSGKMIYSTDIGYQSDFVQTIDISSFSKGIYLIKFQAKEFVEMRKIIIH